MKFLVVASVLFLSGADAYNMPQPECYGVDRRGKETTCNKMQQENRGTPACKNGGKVMRDIEFKKLQICSNGDFTIDQIADSANYDLILRGPAVEGENGLDVEVTKAMMTAQSAPRKGPGCLTATWKMQIDTCQPYFEAEFRAWPAGDADNKFSFVNYDDPSKQNDGQFLRRTCDLVTKMTCTGPKGDSCDDLNKAMCTGGDGTKTSGTFDYTFCYANMEKEHEVTVRNYYTKCDQNPDPPPTTYKDRVACTETHTFFNETLINPELIPVSGVSFPGALVLPPNPDGNLETCFTYSRVFDACKELLPDARLNVVGSVTRAVNTNDRTASTTRFRACYDQTRVEAVDIKLRDSPEPPTGAPTPEPEPDKTDAPTTSPLASSPDDPDVPCSTSNSKSTKSCKSGKGKGGDTRRLRKKRRNDRKNQERF